MSWVLLIILAVLALLIVGTYNQLVRLKIQCENAWSDIDVQLKRRYDLIPNLIETVKMAAAPRSSGGSGFGGGGGSGF